VNRSRQPTPDQGSITAVLGPTNTGKTHYAVERMLSRATGIIGLPLRLLAREIYDRVCQLRGPGQAALITGEEKIQPPDARYFICTAEAMPLEIAADFVAVDEIQLCADPERGHVFTDRLLHARGRYETLFMGSDNMRGRIARLVPRARFQGRERFSTLSYTGNRKISRLKPRTAVVGFSADQVYAIAELIRRQRGGAAVVLGALSPRTRNAKVALYQNGDVDYIVATDAIGMGLNMDVDHIAFAGLNKFDGHRHRRLEPNELAQIAGRAGRYTKDGTFSVTAEASPLDPEVFDAIKHHRFKPLTRLMWRNSDLDFVTVPALIDSLEAPPDAGGLMRRLKQKERLVAEVNDKCEVSVEGHFVGRLDGFRFTVDETAASEEIKTLRSASLAALQAELGRRADKLYVSPDTEIEVTEQGDLMWGADAIGRLEKGEAPLSPRVRVFVDDIAETAVAEKVERRLNHWIARRVNTLLEPMLQMRDDETVTGLARGVAFQIAEAMGVVPRRQVADDVKAIGQEERGFLRKHGVRFGQHNVFMPLLLKPAPTRLRLILWSLWEGFDEFPEAPPAGLITIPALESAPRGYYEKVGYRLCGQRTLRIGMLERLADLIRPTDVRGGFEASPDMLSITGCTLEQFADIMKSLGFDGERGERPKPPRPAPQPATEETTGEAGPATAAETEAETGAEASPEEARPEMGAETDATATEAEAIVEPAAAAESPELEGAETGVSEPEIAAEAAMSAAAGTTAGVAAEAAEDSDETPPAQAEAAAEGGEIAKSEDAGADEAGAGAGETGEPETEVFYIFKLRQRQRSGPPGRRFQQDGPGDGGRKPGPGRRGKRGPKGKGPRREDSDGPRPKPKPERRREEKSIDPLSPFAILQQLKDK